ncbi:MAG TPA: glycosyltransferase family 2 protein [Candidatus Dormibacteraeota bacterium]|nr:glycosyltransferase family 2 protein [Candidatus Dormibacteraeota bacterium]
MSQETSGEAARPAASVVIVNYNGLHYLDACLGAVLAQELEGGFEVVIVDNGSVDGSVAHLREAWPAVRVVEAGENLGFAAGNNLGMRESRGRHLVLLNNDTRVRAGWLRALVAAAEGEDGVGAVTSKLIFLDRPQIIQNAGGVVLSDGSGGDRGTGEKDSGQFGRREEVFNMCGAAVLLTRAMLDEVGDFDEEFFMYYEDTDLSWRMRMRGWRVLYEPEAVVEHVHSGSSVEWSPFFTFHVDRNRLFMLIKDAPARLVLRAFVRFGRMSAGFAVRMVLRRLRRRNSGATGAAPVRGAGANRALIQFRVLASLLRHLPSLLRKRRSTRSHRSVADDAIVAWFIPREQWHVR